MKKLQFYKFDPSKWLIGAIQHCTKEEIGTYINLCALVMENGGKVPNDHKLCRKLRLETATANEQIALFVDEDLIQQSEGHLSVKFITEQIEDYAKVCSRNRTNALERTSDRKRPQATALPKVATATDRGHNKNKNKNKNLKNNTNSELPFNAYATLEQIPPDFVEAFKNLHKPHFITYKVSPEEQYRYMAYYLACDKDGYPIYMSDDRFNPSIKVSNWTANSKKMTTSSTETNDERSQRLYDETQKHGIK